MASPGLDTGIQRHRLLWVKGRCRRQLMVQPVCPQLRQCRVRHGNYAWCQERASAMP